MPRLSLGLGVQTIRKVGAAAPSGIPVASTNQIIVTNTGGFNGTYTRRSAGVMITGGYGELAGTGYSYSITEGLSDAFMLIGPQMTVGGYGNSSWVFIYGYDDSEYGGVIFDYGNAITNPTGTSITTIPITGWSQGITITAA